MTREALMRGLERTLAFLHGLMEFLLISSLAIEAFIAYTTPTNTKPVILALINIGAQVLSSWLVVSSYVLLLLVPLVLLLWLCTLYHCSFRGVFWQHAVEGADPLYRSPHSPRQGSDRCAGGDGWWLEDSEEEGDVSDESNE